MYKLKLFSQKTKEPVIGYLFILPALLLLLFFVFIPTFQGIYFSLTSWEGIGRMKFIGLSNYREFFLNPLSRQVILNTLEYTFGVVFFQMLLALLLALTLNSKRIHLKEIFRTAYFLPVLVSSIASSIVWKWFLGSDGPLTYFCNLLGINIFGGWLTDTRFAMWGIILMNTWRWAGYLMVIYLAGLQAIPEDLYEAAIIDGANTLAQFRYITWPMLSFTTFFVLTTSLIGSFQMFEEVYVMTGGGPLNATNVMGFYLYENAFKYLRMGYASMIGCVMAGVIFIITVIQFRITGQWQSFKL